MSFTASRLSTFTGACAVLAMCTCTPAAADRVAWGAGGADMKIFLRQGYGAGWHLPTGQSLEDVQVFSHFVGEDTADFFRGGSLPMQFDTPFVYSPAKGKLLLTFDPETPPVWRWPCLRPPNVTGSRGCSAGRLGGASAARAA